MNFVTTLKSPVGGLLLASDGARLTGLWLEGQRYWGAGVTPQAASMPDLPVFRSTGAWLERYFAGEGPDSGELPLAPAGSVFRRRIWQLLCEIPYGQTTTYGALAHLYQDRYGGGTSPRAVGGAVGRNPISIVIPCHRVVGADGSMTGYAGGVERKLWLLELEKRA